jgi:signal transduction histidine kinase/ligand-binding sensor domain-containing protein/CheY-like chemotaxis protein
MLCTINYLIIPGKRIVLTLRRIYRHIALGGLLAVFMLPLLARTPFGELRFDRVTSANGLNVAFSTTIIQDSRGYMWYGTQVGMQRYDGYRSKTYKNCSSDPNSSDVDGVFAVYNDTQGRLWTGTARGLCLYDAEHDRFIRYLADTPFFPDSKKAPITKITGDGNGNLWLATDFGLIHFFPEIDRYSLVKFQPEIAQVININIGTALEHDAQGNIWFGSNAGLYRMKPGSTTLEYIRLDSDAHPEPHHNEIIALHIDKQHALWIGTRSGLEVLDTDAPDLARYRVDSDQDIKTGWITDIIQDNQGDMWIATHNDGVFRWDRQTGQFTAHRHDSLDYRSIVGNEVSAVYQDKTGTLWVGTPLDGVSKAELNSGDFRQISQNSRIGKDLIDNKITAIFAAPNHGLWLGTFGGAINLYDSVAGITKTISSTSGLMENSGRYNTTAYKPFAAEGKDKLWVVTESGIRLFNLVKERYEARPPVSGAPDAGTILSIDVDNEGILWALTREALYRLDKTKNSWLRYQMRQRPTRENAADYFTAMFEDRNGKFWITTLNNVELFDKVSGEFIHFLDRPHLLTSKNNSLLSTIFLDSKGNLWVDNESGLSQIEISNNVVTRVQSYSTAGMVDAILEDKRGTLWISTDDGILHYDPLTAQFRHFNSLVGEAVTGYFIDAALIADDGTFYFGGPHGLTAFHPEEIKDLTRPAPPVLITDFQIFNKSADGGVADADRVLKNKIQTTKAITLPYSDSMFSIEFAALDFKDPSSNLYAYQLQGFDSNWRYTDATARLATYTNLSPGHYLFHVKAANSDGAWNETGAELEITITPPFWQTWWFKLLSLLTLVSALFALYQMRIRVLVRQREALELVVKQRTQEIVQQKNVIEEKNRQLETVNHLQEEHQSELTHFLAVASHDLRQPIHALNIYLGALTDLDVRESARNVFDKMRKCVQIMDEMFLALLDLSLLEAHAVKPRIERFSVATILSLIEVEFTPQANAVGLTLTVEHCSEWIASDPNLIKQILANLTANAVRYTKVGSITLRCIKKGSWLRICVEDTGIGISPSQQSIVFKKFHQLGNADREKAKGIGLGLAIVKRLCELLELPLSLNSVPGRGSTFTIDLPLSANNSHDPNPAAQKYFAGQISLSNVLAVVIDDDEIILDAMRKLLEKWGCVVTTAASGKEAIAMLGTSSRTPDVLICDYRLHVNEDGIETINMLRSEFNQEIAALLITGDASSDAIGELISDNLQVMHKPLRAEVLRDALVKLLYPEAGYANDDVDAQSAESDQSAD